MWGKIRPLESFKSFAVHKKAHYTTKTVFLLSGIAQGYRSYPGWSFQKARLEKTELAGYPRGSVTNELVGECNLKVEHSWKRSNNLNSLVWKIITYWQVSRAEKERGKGLYLLFMVSTINQLLFNWTVFVSTFILCRRNGTYIYYCTGDRGG